MNEKLRETLDRVCPQRKLLWVEDLKRNDEWFQAIYCFAVKARVFLAQDYGEDGFSIHIPAGGDSNNIKNCEDDLKRYLECGLTK